eukprot:g1620.t1
MSNKRVHPVNNLSPDDDTSLAMAPKRQPALEFCLRRKFPSTEAEADEKRKERIRQKIVQFQLEVDFNLFQVTSGERFASIGLIEAGLSHKERMIRKFVEKHLLPVVNNQAPMPNKIDRKLEKKDIVNEDEEEPTGSETQVEKGTKTVESDASDKKKFDSAPQDGTKKSKYGNLPGKTLVLDVKRDQIGKKSSALPVIHADKAKNEFKTKRVLYSTFAPIALDTRNTVGRAILAKLHNSTSNYKILLPYTSNATISVAGSRKLLLDEADKILKSGEDHEVFKGLGAAGQKLVAQIQGSDNPQEPWEFDVMYGNAAIYRRPTKVQMNGEKVDATVLTYKCELFISGDWKMEELYSWLVNAPDDWEYVEEPEKPAKILDTINVLDRLQEGRIRNGSGNNVRTGLEEVTKMNHRCAYRIINFPYGMKNRVLPCEQDTRFFKERQMVVNSGKYTDRALSKIPFEIRKNHEILRLVSGGVVFKRMKEGHIKASFVYGALTAGSLGQFLVKLTCHKVTKDWVDSIDETFGTVTCSPTINASRKSSIKNRPCSAGEGSSMTNNVDWTKVLRELCPWNDQAIILLQYHIFEKHFEEWKDEHSNGAAVTDELLMDYFDLVLHAAGVEGKGQETKQKVKDDVDQGMQSHLRKRRSSLFPMKERKNAMILDLTETTTNYARIKFKMKRMAYCSYVPIELQSVNTIGKYVFGDAIANAMFYLVGDVWLSHLEMVLFCILLVMTILGMTDNASSFWGVATAALMAVWGISMFSTLNITLVKYLLFHFTFYYSMFNTVVGSICWAILTNDAIKITTILLALLSFPLMCFHDAMPRAFHVGTGLNIISVVWSIFALYSIMNLTESQTNFNVRIPFSGGGTVGMSGIAASTFTNCLILNFKFLYNNIFGHHVLTILRAPLHSTKMLVEEADRMLMVAAQHHTYNKLGKKGQRMMAFLHGTDGSSEAWDIIEQGPDYVISTRPMYLISNADESRKKTHRETVGTYKIEFYIEGVDMEFLYDDIITPEEWKQIDPEKKKLMGGDLLFTSTTYKDIPMPPPFEDRILAVEQAVMYMKEEQIIVNCNYTSDVAWGKIPMEEKKNKTIVQMDLSMDIYERVSDNQIKVSRGFSVNIGGYVPKRVSQAVSICFYMLS